MPRQVKSRYVEDPSIRSMRVRSWFYAVFQASGMTPLQLEREFAEKGSKGQPRSCIWNKYRSGKVVPRSGRQDDGRPKLVERVEARYPGTARWLFSPLWRLADKAPMEMSEIRQVFERLPRLLRSIFVASPKEAKGLFWRRPVDTSHACEILLRFGDLNALVAILAIVKEAETIQDQWRFSVGIEAAERLLRMLQSNMQINPIVLGDLINYLQLRWAAPGYFEVDSHINEDAPLEIVC